VLGNNSLTFFTASGTTQFRGPAILAPNDLIVPGNPWSNLELSP
jgi:hypothetical protein